jgi:hypothetical protein
MSIGATSSAEPNGPRHEREKSMDVDEEFLSRKKMKQE